VGKKRSNGYGRGTFVDTKTLLSPAYLSLGKPGSARVVSSCSIHLLNSLLLKRQFARVGKKGVKAPPVRVDENRFILTYKELQNKPFNFTQPRITRAIDELLEKGFISIVKPGGEYIKHKAVYGLVDDFLSWQPGDPPVRVRPKDVHRGYQGQGKGAVKKIPHTRTYARDAHADVCKVGTVSTGDTHTDV
jgi:hypothetical protein